MLPLTKPANRQSSRRQIKIREVKDDILILPNNQYCVILETSSVNFELKSIAEQETLVDTFQNFLNSLPCSAQILIRVREVDIVKNLETLAKKHGKETDKVYREQLRNYSEYVRGLVSGNKILTRRFYIVIPYQKTDREEDFFLVKEQLTLRQNLFLKGMERLGMKAKPLSTLEILDLFYTFYNPDQAKIQELKQETLENLTEGVYLTS